MVRACAAAKDESDLARSARRSGEDLIEEMTPGAVLDLDDPGVGVESQFPDQAFLDEIPAD